MDVNRSQLGLVILIQTAMRTQSALCPLSKRSAWLQEWTCPVALIRGLRAWIDDDVRHYLHSALGYKPPRQFEQKFCSPHNPPFVAP